MFSVRYLDRQQSPLSAEQWAPLFRDAGYSVLKRTSHLARGLQIITSWVGVASSVEQPPMIFLVQARNVDYPLSSKGKQGGVLPRPRWFGSEAEALAYHSELAKEFGGQQ